MPTSRWRSLFLLLASLGLSFKEAHGQSANPIIPQGSVRGYHTFEQIDEAMRAIAQAAPEVASVRQVGTSFEGRPINALCVGQCANGAPSSAGPTVLFTALQHSREPLGSLVSLHYADELARKWLAGEAATRALLARRSLLIVPVVNPDGYAWNIAHIDRASMRMVRKNRRPACRSAGTIDAGIDINRNYDFAFEHDNDGSNPDPCAEDYRGTGAFSEPESIAIRDLVRATRPSLAMNWHSYGRFVNLPYAVRDFGSPPPEVYDTYLSIARGIEGVSGFGYGHPYDGGLYSVNGDASDWMLNETGTFAMSPELGPEMSADFDTGMWPSESALRSLVPEGVEVARRALLAGGALLEPQSPAAELRECSPEEQREGGTDPRTGAPAACSTLNLRLALRNNGVRDAEGDVVVALVSAVAPVQHTAFCASGGPDCLASLQELGAPLCASSPSQGVLPACPAVAPQLSGPGLRGQAAAARALRRLGSVAGGRLYERSTLAATRALMQAAVALRQRKGGRKEEAPLLPSMPTRIDLRDVEGDLEARNSSSSSSEAALSRSKGGLARVLQSVRGTGGPTGERIPGSSLPESLLSRVDAVLLPPPADGGVASGLPAQHQSAPLGLRVRLPFPAGGCSSRAGEAASSICAAAGGTSPALQGGPAAALLSVSDSGSCALYAVSCGGVLTLVGRDQAGCGVCAVLRSARWAQALGVAVPQAPAEPSPAAIATPSATAVAVTGSSSPSGPATGSATGSPAASASASPMPSLSGSPTARASGSSVPSADASPSDTPFPVLVEEDGEVDVSEEQGAAAASPGPSASALPWPWEGVTLDAQRASAQVQVYAVAAALSFVVLVTLLWRPVSNLGGGGRPGGPSAMRIESSV